MSVSHSQEGHKSAVMLMRWDCDSHPFQDRRIILDNEVKVGRSVGRIRPLPENAIFDCKVLSRRHALIWYKDGRFWLQDTKSSNGTFVNNTRVPVENAERELFSGDIIRFGVDVVENDTTYGSIITQITLYLPNGEEALPDSRRKSVDLSRKMLTSETYHAEQLFLLTNSISKALIHEQILEAKMDTMKTLLDETQKISAESWQAMLNEEHLLEKLSVYEAQLSILKQNLSEETLQGLVTELQEKNYDLKSATEVSLEKAISERMEALMKANELETWLANSERDCARLREECESTKEAYQSITVNLDKKVSELEQLETQLKEVIEEKNRLADKLAERSDDLDVLQGRLAAAMYSQVPPKSAAVNSISCSQPDDNNKQTATVVNGLENGEPAEELGDVVEATGQLQTSLSQRADEVREELALAELNELDRFCDIQERLDNSESELEHMLDSANQDISNHISNRNSVLSNQYKSIELIKALQDELEVLTNLKASISNGLSSGLDPVGEDQLQQPERVTAVDSNDCSVVTTTSNVSRDADTTDKFSAALDRAKWLAVLVRASHTQSSNSDASSLSTNAIVTTPSEAQPQTSGDVVANLVSTQSSRPGDDDALVGWDFQKADLDQQQEHQPVEEEATSTVTTSEPVVECAQSSRLPDPSTNDDELARLRAELRVSSGETEMYRQLSEKLRCQDDAKAELLLSVREECDALRGRIGQIESEVANNRAEHQRLVLDAKRSRVEAEELRASRDELASELSLSEARIEQLIHDQELVVSHRDNMRLATASPASPADSEVPRTENLVFSVNSVRVTPSPADISLVRHSHHSATNTMLSLFTVIPVMVLLCALMAYILSKFKP